jgi:hypothetical protein
MAGLGSEDDSHFKPHREARIERALREFVEGRTTWPSSREFAAAGKGDLYAAPSRNGGIGRRRRAVGL